MMSRGGALSGASLSLAAKGPHGRTGGSCCPARASRANPPLRHRALRARRLRLGFARGTIFTLALRFGLDGSSRLRGSRFPSRPKPYGETKKFLRAPACRALRPRFQTFIGCGGVSTRAYPCMRSTVWSLAASVISNDCLALQMAPVKSSTHPTENERHIFLFLLPAAFPASSGVCHRVHEAAVLRRAGREAARSSRPYCIQRFVCGKQKKGIAAALILRFNKQRNSRIVRCDKVCVCLTIPPPAALSQTPLQGGSAPVDPREDRSERTR